MRVIFDCGANNGDSTLDMQSGAVIHAFEPTPEMIMEIRKKTYGNSNYILNEVAVSDWEGETEFSVAGQGDWGCSSLFPFSEGLDKTWPGREDFKQTQVIKVKVIRLDKYIEEKGITQIDYFHCDTQGSDLNVLKGLGKYISIVKEGVVETSMPGFELYKGTDNSLMSMVEFLTSNGFRDLHITPWSNEYNIHFKR